MFDVEFDRQHKLVLVRFRGDFGRNDIENLDDAIARLVAAEGPVHFLLDFSAVAASASPGRPGGDGPPECAKALPRDARDDPTEGLLIDQAIKLENAFAEPASIRRTASDPILAAAHEVLDSKAVGEKGIRSGIIKSIIRPELAAHVRRE